MGARTQGDNKKKYKRPRGSYTPHSPKFLRGCLAFGSEVRVPVPVAWRPNDPSRAGNALLRNFGKRGRIVVGEKKKKKKSNMQDKKKKGALNKRWLNPGHPAAVCEQGHDSKNPLTKQVEGEGHKEEGNKRK